MPEMEVVPLDLPVHVRKTGSGEPLVLLHGFGASRFTWRYWVEELSRRHTLYLVDLRGFGEATPKRLQECGPLDLASDVHRLVLALDLQRLTLVGHSLGGGVALLTALSLLEAGEGARLSRLVCVSGVAYAQGLPPFVDRLTRPHWAVLLGLVPAAWLIRHVLRSIVYDPSRVAAEQVEGYARPLRTWQARRALAVCARQLVPPDRDGLVARYPQVEAPTLLLWGRQDPVVPLSVGERLARELPRARLVVLERCGHLPAEEHPGDSLRVMRTFLEEPLDPAR